MSDDEVIIPLGRGQGRGPVSQATDEQLASYIAWQSSQFDAGKVPERYARSNEIQLAAAEHELARRKNGGEKHKPNVAQKTQAIQTVTVESGAFSSAQKATEMLRAASQEAHLLTPAPVVAALPEGCEVFASLVYIDPHGKEVYNITGDRKNPQPGDTVGIDRVGLVRLSQNAGASWLYSRRTDDGRHPHYCSWEAMIRYRHFDGTVCTVPGNVEIDVREPDGAAYVEIVTKAKKRKGYDGKPADPTPQLMELRKFLARHAESKAMNRAIANLGIRRSYKRFELEKPFYVARLAFTGRSDDPETRREFRSAIAQSFLGSSAALYPSAPTPPALQAAPPQESVSSHGEPVARSEDDYLDEMAAQEGYDR